MTSYSPTYTPSGADSNGRITASAFDLQLQQLVKATGEGEGAAEVLQEGSQPIESPADIEAKMNRIFQQLKLQLSNPKNPIHDYLTITIDENVLLSLVQRFPSLEENYEKAGYLMALLARKKFSENLKPLCREVALVALRDKNEYIVQLGSMLLSFLDFHTIKSSIISKSVVFKKFIATLKTNYAPKSALPLSILPQELQYLSLKAINSISPQGFHATPHVNFKQDYVRLTESERLASYGITSLNTPDLSNTHSGTPPLTTSQSSRPRQSSSIFIPSTATSNSFQPKSATLRKDSEKTKKESKVVMMDFADIGSVVNSQKKAKEDAKAKTDQIKAEKLAVKENKLREREEKKAEKLAAEEGRRLRMDQKKRKSSTDMNNGGAESPNKIPRFGFEDESLSFQSPTSAESHSLEPQQIIEPPSEPVSFEHVERLHQVIEGAELRQEDVSIVSEFLRGRYVKTPGETKEFKLSESFVEVNGVRKRESLYLILDYGMSSWRKVKRTKKA